MIVIKSLGLNRITLLALALALVSGTARAETLPSAVWAFDLLARVEQWQSVEPLDFLRNVHFAQRWEADGSLVDADAARLQIQAHYRRMPMYFEPNVGQVAADVKFLARGPGYALFLTADEAVLALRPSRSVEEPETAPANSGAVIRTRLEGTTRNPQAHPAGVEKLPSVSHYLLGNDPKKWRTNVPHYAQVRYPNVYPGIDLVYYGNPEHLEHDFIVAPGADPSVIRWVISGAQQVRVNLEGDLMLTVPGGEVVQQAPRIYQMIEGQQQWVAGRYVLHDPESAVASTVSVATSTTPALEALQVGFEVAQYDRQQSLVIDPVLVYSTYLGGVKDDYGNGIAVDDDGFAYVTGGTAAIDFPEKLNSFIWTKTHVKQNAFVSKFDFSQSGTDSLVYSTYLDGSDDKDDIGYGVAVESILINGIVNTYTCVTGMTASTDFPLGGGKLAGGKDAFIVCLDKSGGGPVFSTYLGGTKDDEGRGIAMKWPMIYVTGQTNSINFPLTNPFQPALLGGIDAFVSQINALSGTGMPPIYSTYLGGAKDDKGAAIAVDNSGNIYITGSTASTNFPVTGASAFDSTLGGSLDGFIAKIEPGSMGMYSLAYSAYVGGSSTDSGAGVAVDSNSDVYVTGATSSSNFPVTPNAAQANYGGSGDAFIIKVDPLLTGSTSLIYSTYLGGKGADSGASIAVIKRTGTGLIHTYVTGATASTDFPVTSGSNADNTLGGSGDAFIAQISEHGDQWLYVTYLGGDNGVDSGAGITADETSIYVTGATGASDFPVTTMPPSVAFDMVLGSSKDAFVVKLKDFLFTLTILKAGSGTGTVASLPAGIACGSFCSAIYAGTTSTGGTYVTLTATAANGSKFAGWSPPYCGYLFLSKNETCTATFTLNPVPPPSTSSPSSIVLSGNYDGNKTADLIWHHAVSGHTYGMLLNGFAIIDAKMFHYEPDTAWRIVQNGDLDGNGQDDLLWWNNLTGQVWWMPMNGLNIAGGGQIYQEPDTAWQITAVGDLNGDGKDDLVWRHQISGDVYGMLMNGGAIVSQGMFYSEHINWQILAARDFNGDGKADLLWRNNSTGQVWLMPMDGLTIAGGAMIHTAPLAWNIVAVGDFNNDQRNDLIWWNQYTGQVWGMLMNGYLISAQGLFYIEPDTNWRIVSSGDYTGDGNADLLWRHADGRIYEMAMDGLTVIGGQQIYQEANPDWRIVADAETSPLPPPSRSLPGASRFAPLEGEPLNPYQPFDGEPVNPNLLPAQ